MIFAHGFARYLSLGFVAAAVGDWAASKSGFANKLAIFDAEMTPKAPFANSGLIISAKMVAKAPFAKFGEGETSLDAHDCSQNRSRPPFFRTCFRKTVFRHHMRRGIVRLVRKTVLRRHFEPENKYCIRKTVPRCPLLLPGHPGLLDAVVLPRLAP